VVSWLFFLVQEGFLISKDEFITAERSREMLLLGRRGAVRDNFEVSVVKPPLQYWLTTFTLPRFNRPQTAVRIWPVLFGTLTAIASACC
jgi:4-amino-4-deoxy-L-arabinose transferase-like glycosyltransferase